MFKGSDFRHSHLWRVFQSFLQFLKFHGTSQVYFIFFHEMPIEKLLRKIHVKSRNVKKKPNGLLLALADETIAEIVGRLDFQDKMNFRAASKRTKEIVDRDQFVEFKRYQKGDPELLRTVVHFVENGFSPPLLRAIIDVHQRLMRLTTFDLISGKLCDLLLVLYKKFFKQAMCHFKWATFKLLSTITAIEILMISTNLRFSIVCETPNILKLSLLTLYKHDKVQLIRKCGGDIIKFISALAVTNLAHFGQTPQQIFLLVKSSPKSIQAFKAFLSNGKFHIDSPEYMEASIYFPAGEMQ